MEGNGDEKIQSLPLRSSQSCENPSTSSSLPDAGLVAGLSELWPPGHIKSIVRL